MLHRRKGEIPIMPENAFHSPTGGTPRSLVLLMAVASGAVVANLYYSQPLLAEIARSIHIGESQAGIIPALTQIGYGLGLLFLTPLGDQAERRRLIVTLVLLAATALALTGAAPSAAILLPLNLLVGLLSCVPQIIVPFIAALSAPVERSRNVGTVMSGLLIGILLARTVSGFIGEHLGWRTVYFSASVVMVLLAVLLRLMLPASRPENGPSYLRLLASLPELLRKLPVLQESALSGALLFAAFSVFWSTLVFRLEALPFHLGAQAAGLFGLAGAAGALAASLSGRLADRLGPSRIVMGGCGLVLFSWVLMWLGDGSLWALAFGAALLDLGIQGAHVANQARIFAHMPEARSRINTVYMTSFFAGGAIGSIAGSYAWREAGWLGVCLLGATLMGLALLSGFMFARRSCGALESSICSGRR
jgi:predicted MFS family arabinose efflux permease